MLFRSFRLADSQWRAGAASKQIADDKVEAAREQLNKMIRDLKRPEEKDLILNLLDGDQDEVSLLSRRLLQMHYMNLAENKERYL